MNILERICRLVGVVLVLASAAGVVPSAGQVNEVCVIGGDIHYCAPKEIGPG